MGQKILKIGRQLYHAGHCEGRNIQHREDLEVEYYELPSKQFDFTKLPDFTKITHSTRLSADNLYVVRQH